MLIVDSTTHAVLKSKKDEMAVVAVGSALSNANIVLQLQNIKTSFFVTPVSFVAMCVQVMVEFFFWWQNKFIKVRFWDSY